MQAQRINITLPTTLLKQLQTEIPQGKRSGFVAKAVAEKLAKERREAKQKAFAESLKANYEFDKKVMKDWAVTEIEGWPD